MVNHSMNERRACIASGIARSTLQYLPVPRNDPGLIYVIQDFMALNPQHGFGLLHARAHHQGRLG